MKIVYMTLLSMDYTSNSRIRNCCSCHCNL